MVRRSLTTTQMKQIGEIVLGAVVGAILLVAAGIEVGEGVGRTLEWVFGRYWHRRRSSVGPEALPGQLARVITPIKLTEDGFLIGQVQLRGEIWRARLKRHGKRPFLSSMTVRVADVDGLTLIVCESETSDSSTMTCLNRP